VVQPDTGRPRGGSSAIDDAEFSDNLDQTRLDAYRLARRLGWSHDDALDIVQDASLRAWRYRHTRRGYFGLGSSRSCIGERIEAAGRWLTVPVFWREGPLSIVGSHPEW